MAKKDIAIKIRISIILKLFFRKIIFDPAISENRKRVSSTDFFFAID